MEAKDLIKKKSEFMEKDSNLSVREVKGYKLQPNF